MAELADAVGLGPAAARRGGSTPSIPTKLMSQIGLSTGFEARVRRVRSPLGTPKQRNK